MLLFELFASLGLDTTTFRQQAGEAVAEGETVAESVSDSFKRVQDEAEATDTKLNDLETKSKDTNAILEGFANAAQEVVQEVIEGIIEFGAQSIEAAAATGSELADSFNTAKSGFDTTLDALKVKVGNTLLPIATGFYDLAASISGVTDTERLTVMLDQIDSYSFENMQSLSNSLDSIFGRFETVEYGDSANVEDMTSALDSQIEYWQQYNETLSALQQKGIDTNFLAQIADGTVQSFGTLKALEEADAQQLETMMASFETLESVKGSTVQALNEMQLYVDEDYRAMVESVGELVAGMDQSEAAYANALLTGQAVEDGLSAAYPNIVSLVDSINATLAQMGSAPNSAASNISAWTQALNQSFTTNEMGWQFGFGSNASGLSYVPYDGYRTELHRGEAVITRQENEARSAGATAAADNSALITEVRALKDAILGMQIILNGKTVGRLITSTVNEEIAWQAGVY